MRLSRRSALRIARRRSSNDNRKTNQVRIQLSSALAKVASKVAQVSDLEAILAHTQDDREASEALVNIFAEKLKAAAAEKKELKKELAALENTVCELEDRLDTALDDADDDDDDGDFADRLSSEEARAGEELVGAACGRRYTFEQRDHTIKLLGKQVMPSQIPGILVRFKVFDISCCASQTKVFFLSAHGDHFLTLRPPFLFSMMSLRVSVNVTCKVFVQGFHLMFLPL